MGGLEGVRWPQRSTRPVTGMHQLVRRRPTIRAQLERILDSATLQASPRRRAFLRYLVEETLAGRADGLKGYSLGLAVFGRDGTFDPQSDPVVRLEARRLRRDLDSYYVDAGARDPVRITIPKGRYVPHFKWHQAPTEAPPSDDTEREAGGGTVVGRRAQRRPPTRRMVPAWPGAAAGASASWPACSPSRSSRRPAGCGSGSAAHRRRSRRSRGPAVIVLPFETLSAGEDDRFLASGVTQELITDLMRFEGFRLYSVPASFSLDAHADPVTLGHDLGVGYVVKGSVSSDAATVRVGAQLFDAQTGQCRMERDLRPRADAGRAARRPGGACRQHRDGAGPALRRSQQRHGGPPVDRRRAEHGQLRLRAARLHLPAHLPGRAPPAGPGLPRSGGASATPTMPSPGRCSAGCTSMPPASRFVPDAEVPRELGQALDFASKAVAIDPENVVALRALSAVQYHLGNFDESERIQRQALALNPNDPDTLAQLGWRLAFRGRWEEGLAYSERAIARTIDPPGWYYDPTTIHLYLEGRYREMLASAEHSAAGDYTGVSLLAIAHGALGNHAAAQEALATMAEQAPAFNRDPAAVWRRFHLLDSIVDASWTACARPAGLNRADRPCPTENDRSGACASAWNPAAAGRIGGGPTGSDCDRRWSPLHVSAPSEPFACWVQTTHHDPIVVEIGALPVVPFGKLARAGLRSSPDEKPVKATAIERLHFGDNMPCAMDRRNSSSGQLQPLRLSNCASALAFRMPKAAGQKKTLIISSAPLLARSRPSIPRPAGIPFNRKSSSPDACVSSAKRQIFHLSQRSSRKFASASIAYSIRPANMRKGSGFSQ